MDYSEIEQRLRRGEVVLLDGAMGTELQRRGMQPRLPLWSAAALIDDPDLVRRLHGEYADAGAMVVIANTFRTNPRSVRKSKGIPRGESLTQVAVALAQSTGRVVAGSMAPVEDCWKPERVPPNGELADEHALMAQWLKRAGADLILVETMNTIREAQIATEAAAAVCLPTWTAFSAVRGRLRSGEDLGDAIEAAKRAGAVAVLVNCVNSGEACDAIPALQGSGLPFGAYPNVGDSKIENGREIWTCDEEDLPHGFTGWAERFVEAGGQIIGGCCGTTPGHIEALRPIADGA